LCGPAEQKIQMSTYISLK